VSEGLSVALVERYAVAKLEAARWARLEEEARREILLLRPPEVLELDVGAFHLRFIPRRSLPEKQHALLVPWVDPAIVKMAQRVLLNQVDPSSLTGEARALYDASLHYVVDLTVAEEES